MMKLTDRELNQAVWRSLGHQIPMPADFNPVQNSAQCIELICNTGMSFGNDGKTSPSEFRRKACLLIAEGVIL